VTTLGNELRAHAAAARQLLPVDVPLAADLEALAVKADALTTERDLWTRVADKYEHRAERLDSPPSWAPTLDGPVSTTGHRWPCTRYYVTASRTDRCTCDAPGDTPKEST
jgi:hypothetical protein